EEQIHTIYEQLNVLKLRVNFLQTSAISVSIIIDQQLFKLEQLVNSLKNKFIIRYNEGLELLTVLHPDRKDFSDLNPGYEILLE
ncbi:MAG TPA: aspartate kinase, partial [Algoriphagus sp.]|nr:aspartate kinase [Algoriphagus sp.]